jgi:hypothetical protein
MTQFFLIEAVDQSTTTHRALTSFLFNGGPEFSARHQIPVPPHRDRSPPFPPPRRRRPRRAARLLFRIVENDAERKAFTRLDGTHPVAIVGAIKAPVAPRWAIPRRDDDRLALH